MKRVDQFRPWVDYDYDTERNCNAYGCDGICRCGKIVNLRITGVHPSVDHLRVTIPKQYKKFVRQVPYKMTTIERYCADRLLRIHKTYDTSLYEVRTCRGYYGEETDGASFDHEHELLNDVNKMLNIKDDIDKVKFVLECEYTYLLDKLVDTKTVTIDKIRPVDLRKNDEYASRLKRGSQTYELCPDVPVGIVHDGRLIDGYHRFSTLDPNKLYSFIVFH